MAGTGSHHIILLTCYMSFPLQGETNELIVIRDWSHKTFNIVKSYAVSKGVARNFYMGADSKY